MTRPWEQALAAAVPTTFLDGIYARFKPSLSARPNTAKVPGILVAPRWNDRRRLQILASYARHREHERPDGGQVRSKRPSSKPLEAAYPLAVESRVVCGANAERRAYIFYATDDAHALAVMVFVHLLRRLSGAARDCVVLHHRVSAGVVAEMRRRDIVTVAKAPVRPAPSWYFRHCLLKLRIFEPMGYDRLMYFDVDSIPREDPEPLFDVAPAAALAAPRAFWLPAAPWSKWSSALMVLQPSAESAARLSRRVAASESRNLFDMDVVNAEFGGEITELPAGHLRLSSEWNARGEPPGGTVVHFSGTAKPWSVTPSRLRRLLPAADPFLLEIWRLWWNVREEVVASFAWRTRARAQLAKRYYQRVRLKQAVDVLGLRLL